MGSFIVIEGPDGTGKTTLAEEIRDRYSYGLVHCGPPEKDAFRFYHDKLRRAEGPTVVDRLHVGSWVYGKVFRNGPDMTDQEEWLFEGWLLAHGAVLALCVTDVGEVEKNLARGPDNEDAKVYEVPEKRSLLRKLYLEAGERTQLPKVFYDYTTMSRPLVAARLVELSQSWQDRPKFELSAIGNLVTPRYVFVGDRPNTYDTALKRARKGGYDETRFLQVLARMDPGYCWGSSLSGRYLFQALRAAGLSLLDYCTFNSVQWDGRTLKNMRDEDPSWFDRRGSSEFVALGNLAAEQLERAGIPYRLVPHPQFVRRFHYKRVLDYAELLAGKREYVKDEWSSV